MPAAHRDYFRKKAIRDPLYGFIDVSDLELRVIDSEVFRRLLSIKQLSHAYVVYPTAIHSRFEHSLGTMHIADRMAQELELRPDDRENIRLAALLHDVGHGPFSHLFESSMKRINPEQPDPHEKISQIIISEDPELGDLLGDTKNRVIDLLKAEPGFGNPESLLASIISSGLDADKLDYLRRDSHHIGVAYGQFDLARILHNLSTTNNRSRVLVDRGGKDALENYRLARYLMHIQVYEHHARLAADNMFRKALDIAIHDEGIIDGSLLKFSTLGKNESFLNFYKSLDDYSIYRKIVESEKSKSSKEILTNIQRRKLLKRACDFTPDVLVKNEDVGTELMKMTSEKLDDMAADVAASLNLKPHEVIFHKSQIEIKLYKRGEILFKHKDEILDLSNTSPFMIKDSAVVRYYVFGPADVPTRKSIAEKTTSMLGLRQANISHV